MTLREFLKGIADAIRTVEGSTGYIPASSFRPRILALSNGSGGGGGGGGFSATAIPSIEDDLVATATMEVFEVPSASAIIESYFGFYSYNGVRLPTIPEVSGYPYVFIQKGSSRYDLVFSKTKYWYQESDDSLRTSDYSGQKNYLLTFADFEAGATWSHRNDVGYYWENFTTRQVWSNYDIAVGSASGSDIKFKGTTPYPVS